MRPTNLRVVASVIYTAHDAHSGLMEREFDHVVIGRISTPLSPDPNEVAELRFVMPDELIADVREHPAIFAPWVPYVLDAAISSLV